jgi:hypothetical protein
VPLVDLLLFQCGRRFGVEIERMDSTVAHLLESQNVTLDLGLHRG